MARSQNSLGSSTISTSHQRTIHLMLAGPEVSGFLGRSRGGAGTRRVHRRWGGAAHGRHRRERRHGQRAAAPGPASAIVDPMVPGGCDREALRPFSSSDACHEQSTTSAQDTEKPSASERVMPVTNGRCTLDPLAVKTGKVRQTLQPHAGRAMPGLQWLFRRRRLVGPARFHVAGPGSRPILAVLGVSPSLRRGDRAEAAQATAAQIGVRLVEAATEPRPLLPLQRKSCTVSSRPEWLTQGVMALAATEHAVLRPLADTGLTKSDVQAVARALDLPCADKSAAVPGLPDTAPPTGDTATARPDRTSRASRACAGVRRLPSSSPRAGRPGRTARRRPSGPPATSPVPHSVIVPIKLVTMTTTPTCFIGTMSAAVVCKISARQHPWGIQWYPRCT